MSDGLSEADFLALPLAEGPAPAPSGQTAAYFDADGAMWLLEAALDGLARRRVWSPSPETARG